MVEPTKGCPLVGDGFNSPNNARPSCIAILTIPHNWPMNIFSSSEDNPRHLQLAAAHAMQDLRPRALSAKRVSGSTNEKQRQCQATQRVIPQLALRSQFGQLIYQWHSSNGYSKALKGHPANGCVSPECVRQVS